MTLQEYMTDKSMTDAQMAKIIGTSSAAVCRYRNRKRRPEWPVISKIKTATDGAVTADDFMPTKEVVR